jgi:uncharacterized repeat protein (TIGR04052 family)
MHRMLKIAVPLATALVGLAACSDTGDDTLLLDASVPFDAGDGMQSVMLRFKAKLGNEDLVCGQSYANQGSNKVRATPQDFRFFVQDVKLINAAGQEVPVTLDERSPFQTKDVALIDFTDATGGCTSGGATTNMALYGRVPVGNYNGIVFVNGVPTSLNHLNPATAPAPLQAPGASWDWQSGYRFVMAEIKPTGEVHGDGGLDGGVADAGTPTHDAGPDGGMGGHGGGGASTIHVGSTGCNPDPTMYGCTIPNRNLVRLTGFNPLINTVVADLSAVFANIELTTSGSQCHGSGPICAAGYAALGIGSDGKPTTTQQVYRVE